MTGYGIKVAVIDTGVNAAHPHICAPTHAVEFDPEDSEASCQDVLGHGTAVTAAIQEKASHADYYILKLFGDSLRTSSSRLIRAIDWTIDHGMDVVNLSLGSPNMDYARIFDSLVRRAAVAGVVLVAARCGPQGAVLPGMLPGVISVDVDWALPRHLYRISEVSGSPVFHASGFPRPLPGVSPARNLSGISFAVANMTGFVVQACEGMEERSPEKVVQALMCATVGAVYDRAFSSESTEYARS